MERSGQHGNKHGGDDARLIAAVAAKDPAAWREFLRRYLPMVVSAAWYKLGDGSEAEDVAQETMLRFWHKAAEWRTDGGSLKAWLLKVANNLAVDRLRQRRAIELDDVVTLPVSLAVSEEEQTRRERDLDLRRALVQLPPRQQTAIVAFYCLGLNQRETATLLDIGEDAVESLLARGRRRLRDLLAVPETPTAKRLQR